MKKLSLIIGIALVALIAIVDYRNRHANDTSAAKTSSNVYAKSRERIEGEVSNSHDKSSFSTFTRRTADPQRDSEEVKELRRELKSVKDQMEMISRPLRQDILSSTVNAEINPDETLVTGGYRTADGNYELTLLTPRSVTLEDGREAIEMDSKVLSVDSEFVGAYGLESIATNAKNTIQHAEAWKKDDVARTLAASRDTGGISVMTSPKVTVLPSTSFTLKISEKNSAQFSIEGTVARSPNGSYSIQSRIERTPESEENGGGQSATRPESQ